MDYSILSAMDPIESILDHHPALVIDGALATEIERRGQFPTVTSFDYRETITFTHRDKKSIAYEQRTQKRYDGQTEWLVSHWGNGFIRILETGELEMTSAQIGRTEVLIGSIAAVGAMFRIHFVSKTITNDPRMVSSARTFELQSDTSVTKWKCKRPRWSDRQHILRLSYNGSGNLDYGSLPLYNQILHPQSAKNWSIFMLSKVANFRHPVPGLYLIIVAPFFPLICNLIQRRAPIVKDIRHEL
jgi:hypothetical protein